MRIKTTHRILLFFLALLIQATHVSAQQVYQTGDFALVVNNDGTLSSLKTGETASEYAPAAHPGILLQLVKQQQRIRPEKAVFQKGRITLHYPGGDRAVVGIGIQPAYLRFELLDVSEGVDAVVWGPVNTTVADTIGNMIGVVRSAGVAIGLRSLNLKTSGGELLNGEGAVFDNGSAAVAKPFGSSLQAFSVNRSSDRKITVWDRWKDVPVKGFPEGALKGSAIALFGCQPGQVLQVLKTITKHEKLPYAQWKGQWIKTSREPGRPYMITTFDENNADTFLTLAKKMGMAGVYHEELFDTWGHFDVKKTLFPHGRAGFKQAVDKAHAMGLRMGFHILSNFITTNDPFVSPVPSPHLMSAGSSSLTAAIDSTVTDIPVSAPDYFSMKSDLNSVRIGQEIIRFREVSKTAPYHLLGCIRGAFGTRKLSHAGGEKADRLIDHPYMVLFPDMELQKEMAQNVVAFINETGADQMDFDGHEGTYATGMGDLAFNTFAEQVFNGSDHPMMLGSSRANHRFWQINDYLNWGEPWYGGFRESQSDVRIANQPFYEHNYLPNMLGWFLITDQTSTEDIDWMLGRAAGYNAGYALVVREKALSNPHMDDIVSQIRLWTEAQQLHLFNPEQRQWLKDPAHDVHLYREGANWLMQEFQTDQFVYEARVLQPGQPTAVTWSFENKSQEQYAQFVLLASGKEGSLGHPVLELDHSFRAEIPVNLEAGQSLVIAQSASAKLYDQKGKLIKEIPLSQPFPVLGKGSHELLFDAKMDADQDIKAIIKVKLLENTRQLSPVSAK